MVARVSLASDPTLWAGPSTIDVSASQFEEKGSKTKTGQAMCRDLVPQDQVA